MAPDNDSFNRKITASKKWFTLKEAQEFEREMLKAPTGTKNYRWVDKSGNTVAFNY